MNAIISLFIAICLLANTAAFSPAPSSFIRRAPHSSRAYPTTHFSISPSSAGPAVLERPKTQVKISQEVKKDSSKTKAKGWQLRIYNDSLNTREHVARCLVQVTGKSESEAYQLMMNAHKHGIAIVGIWMFEQAEAYKEALVQTGLVADITPIE
mmetsp:Transcript_23054/g.47794  ORF Transcript_23054/g.47794 Transcript_23054/m.47794 type:complete len:154 (-) Transcript_23054:37-498(-)